MTKMTNAQRLEAYGYTLLFVIAILFGHWTFTWAMTFHEVSEQPQLRDYERNEYNVSFLMSAFTPRNDPDRVLDYCGSDAYACVVRPTFTNGACTLYYDGSKILDDPNKAKAAISRMITDWDSDPSNLRNRMICPALTSLLGLIEADGIERRTK